MPKISLIEGDAAHASVAADIIFTDPPYDMDGEQLAEILCRYDADHLVMLTTMRQLMRFSAVGVWKLAFDFVFDAVVPKNSKARHQPHYTHQTGVYMTRNGAKSRFDRKLRMRSDTFDHNGYWPSIIRAPRDRSGEHGMAKNLTAMTDILGSFDVSSVVDPFAGSGTTALAAYELGIDCTLVEIDPSYCADIRRRFAFFGEDLAA